ncbi:hypothetical protein VR010_13810 [Actinomycetaceae bacterium L2_0104]
MTAPPSLTTVLDMGRDVRVTTRQRTAVDVARLASSETAFVAVCSILGALATLGDTHMDRMNVVQYRERELRARTEMQRMADALANRSGRQRARQIISLASGLVESVAEARVLWLLHAYGFPAPEMQYRISVDGRLYFADFAWPDRMAIVEFNGEGKYGSGEQRELRVAEERARESRLRMLGYRVLNLSWQQLRDHQRLAHLLHEFLNPDARIPRGGVNLQIRHDLLRPEQGVRRDERTIGDRPGGR